ncbi:MAG: hypothetical protein RL375_4323 [Pseudomonadota bacterium]
MTTRPEPVRPAPADAAELAAQQRARACVEAWLSQRHPGARLHAVHTLQRPAQGHAVFACDLAGPAAPHRQVIAKCLAVGNFAAVARRTRLVRQAIQAVGTRVLGAPEVLHIDETHQVLLTAPARGEILASLPADDAARLAEAVARSTTALLELHRLPTATLRDPSEQAGPGVAAHHTAIDTQMAELMRPHPADLAERLAAGAPDAAHDLAHLVERLRQAAAPSAELAPCLVHRDGHPRQIFIGESGVDIIDWDLCGLGDPALDLANLHLHIDLRWPQLGALLHDTVTRSYGAGSPVHRRVPLFLAFHHLRRACKAWRQAGSDTSTLGPATAWLAGATAHLDDHLAGRAASHGRAPASPSPGAQAVRPLTEPLELLS